MFSGSHLIFFVDTLLQWAEVVDKGRLGFLSGLLSSAVEKASDVADSRCIQSHLLRLATRFCGTLLRRRAQANSCQPCGSKSFWCLTASFTKSTMLLPLTTSPSWTNSPCSFQCMFGSCSILFKRFSTFPPYLGGTVLIISSSSLTFVTSFNLDEECRWWSFSVRQKMHYNIEKKPNFRNQLYFKKKYILDFLVKVFNKSYNVHHKNVWEASQIHSTFVFYQLIIGITCVWSWQTSTLIN